MPNTARKERLLADLVEEMNNDMSLPLKEGSLNLVPGEGNVDADIFFVGEAPGKKMRRVVRLLELQENYSLK